MKAARWKNWTAAKTFAWLLVPAALLLFAGANAHLFYVAFKSQPDCVPHLKQAGTPGSGFMAAKPAC